MIQIDLKINTRQVATQPLAKVVAALERIKRLQDEVNAGFGKMANQLAQVGAATQNVRPVRQGAGGGGRAAGSGPRQANPMDIFNFWDRAHKLSKGAQFGAQRQQAFGSAYRYAQGQMASGHAAGYQNMGRLMSSMPKPPKTPGQLWMDVLKTSRFGGGGGGMAPLVGRTATAAASSLGMGAAAAGPIGIAITAAMAVGMAAKKLAEEFVAAAQYLREKVNSLSITGSNASAAGYGLDGGARANAEAVKAAVQGGGMGAARAAAAGIPLNLGSRGNNDYGEALRKARKYISEAKSFEEARRRAEDLGIGEAASSYYLSDGQKAALARPNSAADPATMKRGAQLSYEMDATSKAFEEMRAQIMGPIIDAFIQFAPAIRVVMKILGLLGQAIFELITFVPRMVRALFEWLEKVTFGQVKVAEANTKAIEENTREMKRGRDVRGGGQRSSGATPNKVGGSNWAPGTPQQLGVGLGI